MGELAQEYEGEVVFVIVPAEETEQRYDEIEAFGFTDQRHGLVAFSAEGVAIVKIPGHDYGKPEIEAAVQAALAAG